MLWIRTDLVWPDQDPAFQVVPDPYLSVVFEPGPSNYWQNLSAHNGRAARRVNYFEIFSENIVCYQRRIGPFCRKICQKYTDFLCQKDQIWFWIQIRHGPTCIINCETYREEFTSHIGEVQEVYIQGGSDISGILQIFL